MEIFQSSYFQNIVTNIEVFNTLSERIKKRNINQSNFTEDGRTDEIPKTTMDEKFQHRDFIEQKVFEYLSKTPCIEIDQTQTTTLISVLRTGPSKTLNQAKKLSLDLKSKNDVKDKKGRAIQNSPCLGIINVNKPIFGFGLVDVEVLQIMNHMPRELVELHLFIQDVMQRLDENNLKDILELVSQHNTTFINR